MVVDVELIVCQIQLLQLLSISRQVSIGLASYMEDT
jgi:hypothetical protein